MPSFFFADPARRPHRACRRSLAERPSRHFLSVLTAPAGAGKTSTLNALYAALLAGDDEHLGTRTQVGGLRRHDPAQGFTRRDPLEGLIRNPTDAADPPRPSARKEMQTWSGAQVRAFLDSVDNNRLRGCWWLLANTGIRRGEVLGCAGRRRRRRHDSHRENAHHDRPSAQRITGMAWGTPKTAKGRRTVALDPATVTALRVHRTRQLEERLAMGGDYQDQDLVVCHVDWATPTSPSR